MNFTIIAMSYMYMYNVMYVHTIPGYAVAQWLGIRLQMLGVAMVTGVSFIAVLEHHFNTVDPGIFNLVHLKTISLHVPDWLV